MMGHRRPSRPRCPRGRPATSQAAPSADEPLERRQRAFGHAAHAAAGRIGVDTSQRGQLRAQGGIDQVVVVESSPGTVGGAAFCQALAAKTQISDSLRVEHGAVARRGSSIEALRSGGRIHYTRPSRPADAPRS